jgi:hypothetical protein
LTKTIKVKWLPFGFDGMALRWVILLKNEDKGLIEHELIHIEQQKKHGFIKYMFLWCFNDYKRALFEAEAFKYGQKYDTEKIIMTLVKNYRVSHDLAAAAVAIV